MSDEKMPDEKRSWNPLNHAYFNIQISDYRDHVLSTGSTVQMLSIGSLPSGCRRPQLHLAAVAPV